MNHNNMERFSVRVTARDMARRKFLFRVVLIVLLISVSLLAFGYGLSLFVNNAGNFTVLVPDEFAGSLTLSNTADFKEKTICIEADAVPSMDNITKSWLPEDIDSVDGAHNGDNYIAHTFYVKNSGVKAVDYVGEILVNSSTLGADEAVRVMVIKNGVETVYARPKVGTKEAEPDTAMFAANTKVMSEKTESFDSGAVDKYTVVIWLEGNDPECVDNIRGGVVKMSMNFRVIGEANST